MGVATKSRRKIQVGDKRYIWYVAEDDGPGGMVLHVISTDKHFRVKYQLNQPKGDEYVVVLGRIFAGASTGGSWKRFLCPRFASSAVTPRSVRALIEWCLNEGMERHEVDWRSQAIRI